MIRYRLAWPLLLAHRVRQVFAGAAPEPGFRILLLHDVPAARLPALSALVRYVAKVHGVLSPDEAAAILAGDAAAPLGHEPCLFTFDDGFASNAEAARTILEPNGVRALFFVCPGLMAQAGTDQATAIAKGIFDGRRDAASIADSQRLMSWDELRALQAAGHAIGAHGMTHQRLCLLHGDALEAEIVGSGRAIEENLGARPDWYAYSFGDIDSISPEALGVVGAHHRFCRSGVRGRNDSTTHRLAVRAESIDLAAPLAYQKFILEGGLDARYADARRRLDSSVS